MARESKDYRAKAESDAWDTLDNFVDEMVRQWRESGEISNDLNNDYPNGDSYHHESHTDRDYDLTEAAELLDQLSEYEETDSGLWEGQEPRRAIATQAAFTYSSAVYSIWSELVDDLNEKLAEMRESMEDQGGESEGDTESESNAEEKADRFEMEVNAAGERLIRLYVLLGHRDDEWDGMLGAALREAETGDRTAAMVLADRVQESGKDGLAKMIREAVASVAGTDSEAA